MLIWPLKGRMKSPEEETFEINPTKNLNQAKYAKVKSDGTVNNILEDKDFDFVKQYLHRAFPKSHKVHNEAEQFLKHTFIFGKSSKKLDSSFNHANRKKFTTKKLSKTKLRAIEHGKKKLPKVLSYDDFLEVNYLWNSYVIEICEGEKKISDIQLKLNKMDVHGAYIKVIDGDCSSYVGLEGIIVKESKNAFAIVTPKNSVKTVPKAKNIFDIPLENPSGVLRIAGNSFLIRPAERISKKMKTFMEFVGIRQYKKKLKYSDILP